MHIHTYIRPVSVRGGNGTSVAVSIRARKWPRLNLGTHETGVWVLLLLLHFAICPKREKRYAKQKSGSFRDSEEQRAVRGSFEISVCFTRRFLWKTQRILCFLCEIFSVLSYFVSADKKIKSHLSNMTIDVFYDISMEGCEKLVTLISASRNVVKKGVENRRLCKS